MHHAPDNEIYDDISRLRDGHDNEIIFKAIISTLYECFMFVI